MHIAGHRVLYHFKCERATMLNQGATDLSSSISLTLKGTDYFNKVYSLYRGKVLRKYVLFSLIVLHLRESQPFVANPVSCLISCGSLSHKTRTEFDLICDLNYHDVRDV
jgi:hypothetical protein